MGVIIDNSFIRLKRTLAEALDVGDPINGQYSLYRYDFVQLRPDMPYLQTTNASWSDGIAFNGNYKVEVITPCGEVLLDITNKVAIAEGTNTKTGIKNISFEIVNIGKSWYGNAVCLKFSSTINTAIVFYSNQFHISHNYKDTSYIQYRDFGKNGQTDYNSFPYYQSIQSKISFVKNNDDTEIKSYLQSSGNKIAENNIETFSEIYEMNFVNSYFNKAFSEIKRASMKYVDSVRATLMTSTTDERLGTTNYFKGKATINKDYTDLKQPDLQIFAKFALISKYPEGVYTEPVPISNKKFSNKFSDIFGA